MPLVCFLVGLLGRRAWGTFFSGFFAVFFVWSVKAFWADIQNDQILSNRIGAMVGLGTGEWLFVFTALIGAMLGALATLAGYYTKVAMHQTRLPAEARQLAWLSLDSEAGQEYWLAMNFAGDYASACHDQIHRRMSKALGVPVLGRIENHHNFAWKEQDADGNEIIVHRKGATPAGKGVLGIIPGSMTAPGFIVRGRGEVASINSASHGAGRVMSRRKAKQSITQQEVTNALKQAKVTLIGSGLDEAPMAYKDIREVMRQQEDLVDIVGTFQPRIVRMCGPNEGWD